MDITDLSRLEQSDGAENSKIVLTGKANSP